jgi:hypothetical protein
MSIREPKQNRTDLEEAVWTNDANAVEALLFTQGAKQMTSKVIHMCMSDHKVTDFTCFKLIPKAAKFNRMRLLRILQQYDVTKRTAKIYRFLGYDCPCPDKAITKELERDFVKRWKSLTVVVKKTINFDAN